MRGVIFTNFDEICKKKPFKVLIDILCIDVSITEPIFVLDQGRSYTPRKEILKKKKIIERKIPIVISVLAKGPFAG